MRGCVEAKGVGRRVCRGCVEVKGVGRRVCRGEGNGEEGVKVFPHTIHK